jgi:hypothetical protein
MRMLRLMRTPMVRRCIGQRLSSCCVRPTDAGSPLDDGTARKRGVVWGDEATQPELPDIIGRNSSPSLTQWAI